MRNGDKYLNLKCLYSSQPASIRLSLIITLLLMSLSTMHSFVYSQFGINLPAGEEPIALLDIRATNPNAPTNRDGFTLPKVTVFPDADTYGLVDGTLVYFTGTIEGRQTNSIYVYTELEAWELLSQSGDGIDDDGDALLENQGFNRTNFISPKASLRRVESTSAQNLRGFRPRLWSPI